VNSFPWLTALGLLPLVGAVVVALIPKGRETLAKQVALVVALGVLALTVAIALQFDRTDGSMQFVETHSWIPQFGISYSLGVDGIALVLIALLAALVPVVIIADWNAAEGSTHRPQTLMALFLLLESFVVFVFAATDLFLFYVAFELMLMPIYFLIGMFGSGQRSYAAVKFLLYSLFGGLILLVGVVGLYVVSTRQLDAGTFEVARLLGLAIAPSTQKWLFVAFMVAFAIKAPMVPVHTWLPDAAASGTPGTNTLMVGVLDKVGTFAMLRLALPLFPDAAHWAAPVVVALAVVSVVYAALVAIGQRDMNRLVAYTSVSHFGVIILGVFAFTTLGNSGSVVYMVAHGLSAAAMFLTAGYLIRRRGSAQIDAYGGVARVAPVLAGVFLVAGLATLSLPGLASFAGELSTLVGTYQRWPGAAVASVIGIVLAAVYVLWMYKRVAQGPESDDVRGFSDLGARELVAIVPVLAVAIAIGFFPQTVFGFVNSSVARTMTEVHATDPPPTVPAATDLQGATP
jgi:NADH-quinone oxidoreductase subunit M